ncbi:hypothetical protein glysoja_044191, partial [Glycine soja]
KDSRKRDNKALFLIYQALKNDAFEKISYATSAKEAWDKLQTSHKGEDKVKKVHLQTLRGILAVSNKLKINGEKLEDVRIMEKTLHSLDPKFKHMVVTIEETKDLETMMIKQLQGSL